MEQLGLGREKEVEEQRETGAKWVGGGFKVERIALPKSRKGVSHERGKENGGKYPAGPGEQAGAPDTALGKAEPVGGTESVTRSGNSGKEGPSNFNTFDVILWQLDPNCRAEGHEDSGY